MTTTSLYRHFDRDGVLLYVGISLSAIGRLSSHAKGSDWAQHIATVTVEHFPSRGLALAAETAAIREEFPAFNRVHNGGRRDYFVTTSTPSPLPPYRPYIEEGDEWLMARTVTKMVGDKALGLVRLNPTAQMFVRQQDGRARGNVYYWRRSDVESYLAGKRASKAADIYSKTAPITAKIPALAGLNREMFTAAEWSRFESISGQKTSANNARR